MICAINYDYFQLNIQYNQNTGQETKNTEPFVDHITALT